MAKAANAPEFNPNVAKKTHKAILQLHDDILSARGSYMNRARRIKENIATTIDAASAKGGMSVKVIKLQVQVHQKIEALKELLAKLDAEERKEAAAYAKAVGMPVQLQMFKDLPPAKAPEPKPDKTEAAKKAKPVKKARPAKKEAKPKKAAKAEAPEEDKPASDSGVVQFPERAAAGTAH